MLRRGIHHSVLYWPSTNQVMHSLETRRELAERIAEALGDARGDSADSLTLGNSITISPIERFCLGSLVVEPFSGIC